MAMHKRLHNGFIGVRTNISAAVQKIILTPLFMGTVQQEEGT